MRSFGSTVCILILAFFLPAAAQASVPRQDFAEAEKYYQSGEFSKARRLHLKLAKKGYHESQHRLSQMYARGEGTRTDLTQAYAWAALAAEGGHEVATSYKDDLLHQVEDMAEAHEEAAKLISKYGEEAREEKNNRKSKRASWGSCTGSRISC